MGMLPQPSRPECTDQKQQARCGISKLGPEEKAALALWWIRLQRSLNRLPDLRSIFRTSLRRVRCTNISQQLAEFLIRPSTLLTSLKMYLGFSLVKIFRVVVLDHFFFG